MSNYKGIYGVDEFELRRSLGILIENLLESEAIDILPSDSTPVFGNSTAHHMTNAAMAVLMGVGDAQRHMSDEGALTSSAADDAATENQYTLICVIHDQRVDLRLNEYEGYVRYSGDLKSVQDKAKHGLEDEGAGKAVDKWIISGEVLHSQAG